MGLGSVVRGGIATVKSVIGGPDGLMDNVTIEFWKRDIDEFGTGDFSSPQSFQAVVVRTQKVVKKMDGQEAMATTYLAFIEELPAFTGADVSPDRRQPLDERDIITLSDGTKGPILSIEGLMDEANAAPYLLEVYLG